LSEANVYVNVTYVTVLLKVSMKFFEWEVNAYVNVTYMSVLLKVNMKNLEWGNCLCKCYIYDCSSQSKYKYEQS
jgi:hypothetical protein